MRFDYQISADEYAASQAAQYKMAKGRARIYYGVFWIAIGLFFISIAWNEKVFDWAPVLLGSSGAYWTYCGLMTIFPERHFRRFHRSSGLVGKTFQADVNGEGFVVTGDVCSWRVSWSGVSMK